MRLQDIIEDYFKITPDQSRQALDSKVTSIVDIDPEIFLLLTTSLEVSRDMIKADTKDLDVYNDYADKGEIYVHPFLRVEQKTGKVTGHEGRHRAQAIINKGGKWFRIGLALRPETRQYVWDDMPTMLVNQYGAAPRFSIKTLIATGKMRIVDPNVQAQYQSARDREWSGLPPIKGQQ